METAAGVSGGRGGTLPMPPSQTARKEWRAVSEHTVRSTGNEELERSKLGQSDERTIYEQGTGTHDIDFCSITIYGSQDNDILQQRLHSVSTQREELQRMEIELRSQVIARSEIMGMQNNFDAQIKEHANAAAELKEQLQLRERTIHELEMKMEERDRELRAIKIDNEAAWAKEDLLREQNKELATFRREHDSFEAERAQHLKQIHELKEHIQEKERLLLELEEQHRVTQETILYKDEQLREAQAWIARVQEMDALQSTTNHSLQNELRERTEQFNQFWLGCQRQFADMERLHMHAIQQLQLELAEARGRSGVYTDESRLSGPNSNDVAQFGQNKENQLNTNDSVTLSANSDVLSNGNVDTGPAFTSVVSASTKNDNIPGVQVPSSLLGMGAYLQAGQMPALHPFVMHQQGIPHPVPATNLHATQTHLSHFQSNPAISSHQQWQHQQMPNQNQYQPSETERNNSTALAHYDNELSSNVQVLNSDRLDAHISPRQETNPVISISSVETEVLESNDKSYSVSQPSQPILQESLAPFHDALRVAPVEQNSENKLKNGDVVAVSNNSQKAQDLTTKQPWSATNLDTPTCRVNSTEATACNVNGLIPPEEPRGGVSNSLKSGNIPEPTLIDERSLLACIVRAIPAGTGGCIRISSTLPNRLGKMLAPLHWHDYKKKYGKLDDFVGGHPELFVIEGDFIQLREGAQEIISATAAVAKVAAAAAASSPYSASLPSVAVTPMAQTRRLKTLHSKPLKFVSKQTLMVSSTDARDKLPEVPPVRNQQSNGVSYNTVQGLSNIKILSKPRDPRELNGLKGSINERIGTNFEGNHQGL